MSNGMTCMRYRLRTLLIVLALAPPVLALFLAPVIAILEANPWLKQVLIITALGLTVFAALWLACGLVWLVLMRAVERLLGERRD